MELEIALAREGAVRPPFIKLGGTESAKLPRVSSTEPNVSIPNRLRSV